MTRAGGQGAGGGGHQACENASSWVRSDLLCRIERCRHCGLADVRKPGPRELVWRVSELCYRRAPVRAFSIHGNDALLSGNSLDLFAGPAMEVGRLRAALARREPDA